MTKIIISYRRNDTPVAAGWVADSLGRYFGPENVFIDIDSMPIAVDFRQHLRDVLEDTDFLIAVIGQKWLEQDGSGKSRLDDEDDFVRLEIASALAKNVPVVPLLVDGAAMPTLEQLPSDMSKLTFRHAAYLSTKEFGSHINRLTDSLEELIKRPWLGDSGPDTKPPVFLNWMVRLKAVLFFQVMFLGILLAALVMVVFVNPRRFIAELIVDWTCPAVMYVRDSDAASWDYSFTVCPVHPKDFCEKIHGSFEPGYIYREPQCKLPSRPKAADSLKGIPP